MMNIVALVLAVASVAYGLKVNTATGTTPPPVKCPNDLCYGKYDGNYKYVDPWTYKVNPHYFLQCSEGVASCQACFPLHLIFREDCNQCLKTDYEKCVKSLPSYIVTTSACPDICPKKGHYYSGNIADPYNPYQYVACWQGKTVGCVACPNGLIFNKEWNACVGGKKAGKYQYHPYEKAPYHPHKKAPYHPHKKAPYHPHKKAPYQPTKAPYHPYKKASYHTYKKALYRPYGKTPYHQYKKAPYYPYNQYEKY